MFSAASFAGVIGADDPPVDIADLPRIPVIAFYSLRGGVGRTTALKNLAASFSSRGVSVVAVDLDLEAPELDRVLGCAPPAKDHGLLWLLRRAATAEDEEAEDALRLAPHLTRSHLDVGAPIRVLPAGVLDEAYLERLDDLGVPLWHIMDEANPLEMVISRIKEELEPDVILLDCPSGLSGLAATAVFHTADAVLFLSRCGDDSNVFFKALHRARDIRGGLPIATGVTTMPSAQILFGRVLEILVSLVGNEPMPLWGKLCKQS